ncbi:response regulator transcription factor [Kineococcus auxinigenes]|uniref:response regulator transcription factor n=1 Tax=unclassified Kineococcus TaxID=2621656 RepID=UPI003D7D45C5
MSSFCDKVSVRDLEILEMVAQGRSNEQIGTALHLSTQSIGRYISLLIARMHVSNRAALVARGYTEGLLDASTWPPRAPHAQDHAEIAFPTTSRRATPARVLVRLDEHDDVSGDLVNRQR